MTETTPGNPASRHAQRPIAVTATKAAAHAINSRRLTPRGVAASVPAPGLRLPAPNARRSLAIADGGTPAPRLRVPAGHPLRSASVNASSQRARHRSTHALASRSRQMPPLESEMRRRAPTPGHDRGATSAARREPNWDSTQPSARRIAARGAARRVHSSKARVPWCSNMPRPSMVRRPAARARRRNGAGVRPVDLDCDPTAGELGGRHRASVRASAFTTGVAPFGTRVHTRRHGTRDSPDARSTILVARRLLTTWSISVDAARTTCRSCIAIGA